jgi:hypothetical protein
VLICTPYNELIFPKAFTTIIDWLLLLGANFCAYNMDYDARAILKFLPFGVLEELSHFNYVTHCGYRVHYIPSKIFRVSKGKQVFTMYDCFQFFHTSLANAAGIILHESKLDIPKSWLTKIRLLLKSKHRKKVIDYCKQDAMLCERLFLYLHNQFIAIGIDFNRPISTGALARRKFLKRMDTPLKFWQNDFYRKIFFGGRIEVYRRGHFRNVRMFDINSAYPHALSTFYNPNDCQSVDTSQLSSDAVYGVYDVTVNIPVDEKVSPICVDLRGDGTSEMPLVFPTGLYRLRVDLHTMRILVRKRFIDKLHWSREFFSDTDKLWFPEIPDLYEQRKTRPEVSLAIKLTLNSLYGNFAHRRVMKRALDVEPGIDSLYWRGQFYREVRFDVKQTNYLVAAHVTGFTRARLYEAMEQVGFEHCVMAHTDSVTVLPGGKSIPVGSSLGDWKLERQPKNLVVVGSGVYAWGDDKDGWENRFRGFQTATNLVVQLRGKRRTISTIIVNKPLSLGEAVARKKLADMNVFQRVEKVLNANFDIKREWQRPFKSCAEVLQTNHDSETLVGTNLGTHY